MDGLAAANDSDKTSRSCRALHCGGTGIFFVELNIFRELSPADRGCAIQVQVTTMKIPYRATSSAPKGDRPILEYTTKWSSPDWPA